MSPFKTDETSNTTISNAEQEASSLMSDATIPPSTTGSQVLHEPDLASVFMRNLERSRLPLNGTFRLSLSSGATAFQSDIWLGKDERERTRAILDEALRIVNEDVEEVDLPLSLMTPSRFLPDQ